MQLFTFLPSDRITVVFCCSNMHAWSVILKTELWDIETVVFLQSYLIMPGGHLTRNRKQKNMSNVWPKEWLPT